MTARPRGLDGYIADRRRLLGLSQSRAATLAGVSRTSWVAWEKGTAMPEDYNYVKIERALEWQPGSVEGLLAGGEPTPMAEPEPVEPPLTHTGRLLLELYDQLIAQGSTHEQADAAVAAEIVRIRQYLRNRQQKSPARVNRARPTG